MVFPLSGAGVTPVNPWKFIPFPASPMDMTDRSTTLSTVERTFDVLQMVHDMNGASVTELVE